MHPLREKGGWSAIAALGIGVALLVLDAVAGLPWPPIATRSLAGLFVLAAVTRVSANAGMVAQRYARWAIGGVALTAALWFLAGALLFERPPLALLAFLHVVAAIAGAMGETDAAVRERGRLILAVTMNVISLAALAVLPRAGVPGAPVAPMAMAALATVGAYHVARGRMAGLAATALVGVVSLVLAARLFAEAASNAGLPGAPAVAPLVAATAALGALPPAVALALRLPQIWRILAPAASPGLRSVLAWLTLPAVAAIAVAALAPR